MEKEKQIPAAPAHSSAKMLQAMVSIGVLCSLLIVFTYEGTRPRIQQLKAEALEAAIFKVVPGTTQTKTFKLNNQNRFEEIDGKEKGVQKVYAGYNDEGELMGIALEGSGQGYADILRILYGYNPHTQKVVGFYVLESKETPGLGDKIEKDEAFLSNFKALDVMLDEGSKQIKNVVVPVKNGSKQNPWEVDGITGATISSRAIGHILGESTQQWLPLIYQNLDDFQQAP